MSNLRLLDPAFSQPFESALSRFFSPAAFDVDAASPKLRIDVSEKEDAYIVKADIPGVKKEDIKVRIDDNVVQIDAEVKHEKETKSDAGKVLRSERYYGAISRAFSLAQNVDDAKAQAKYADGVLTLELPKKAATTSRKLTVQ
jgi:HSP20 family protein